MTNAANFSVTPIQAAVFNIDLDGARFRFDRTSDTIIVQALSAGDVVEQLRSTRTADGRRVSVHDETGMTAYYTGSARGDSVHFAVEVGGERYEVQATANDFATELSSAVRDVTLPQPRRLLRFAKHVKTNSALRNALGIADAQGGMAIIDLSCELVCDAAPFLGIFAQAYCVACIVGAV